MSRPATTLERIVGAMKRNGITYDDLAQRVARDEGLPACDAADLVNRLETGIGCPVVVAAAVIAILAQQRMVDRGELPARPSSPRDHKMIA
jgi:hypothetical protein